MSNRKPWSASKKSHGFPAWGTAQQHGNAVRPRDCRTWGSAWQRGFPEQAQWIPMARIRVCLQHPALSPLWLRRALLSGPDWPSDHQDGGEQAPGPHTLHLHCLRPQWGFPGQQCRGITECIGQPHHQPSRWGEEVLRVINVSDCWLQ